MRNFNKTIKEKERRVLQKEKTIGLSEKIARAQEKRSKEKRLIII